MNLDLGKAQDELRAGYVSGAPGVAISGLVWLAAGIVWIMQGTNAAFALLFVGGVAIFPLSVLACRLLFRAGPISKENPLNRLGFETTVPLFAGLFVTFTVLSRSAPLAFSLFATIVGARYFAFATLYRDLTYWALGATLFAAGFAFAAFGKALPLNVALCIGAIELIFSALLFARRRMPR